MQVGFVAAAANTSTGTQDFRDAAMTETPTACIVVVTSSEEIDAGVFVDAIFSFGCATGTTEEWCMGIWAEDGVASGLSRRDSHVNKVVSIRTASGATIDGEAVFNGFLADVGAGAGIQLDWTNAPTAAHIVSVIMFSAVAAEAGTYTTGAAASDTTTVTPGFKSGFILACSAVTSSGSTDTIPASLSLGFCDALLNQWAYAQRIQSAAATTGVSGSVRSDRLISEANTSNNGTELWGSEVTTIDATSFTVTQRTAGGSSDIVGYLALQLDGDMACTVNLIDIPTSTGVQSITYPGVPTEFALMIGTNAEAVDTAYTDNRAGSFFFTGAREGTDGACSGIFAEDGVATTNTGSQFNNNAAAVLMDDDGTELARAGSITYTSVGWDIDWTTAPGTAKKVIAVAFHDAGQPIMRRWGGIPGLNQYTGRRGW
jgi:hypothetical protein